MPIAPVQTKPLLTDAGGSTTQITFDNPPTAGNGVVCYYTDAVAANPIGDPTVSDNQGVGNVYTKSVSAVDVAAGQMAASFRCNSIGAVTAPFIVTFTHANTTNNFNLCAIQECNEAITLDKIASTTTTVAGVTTVTGTALSSTDELITAVYTEDSSRGNSGLTCTPGYSSAMLEIDSNNHISASGNYKVVSIADAPSAIYTVSTIGFTDAVAVLATYQPAGGGGGGGAAATGKFITPLW